jgi:hypothetical protein
MGLGKAQLKKLQYDFLRLNYFVLQRSAKHGLLSFSLA